jgi:hypothetical protein
MVGVQPGFYFDLSPVGNFGVDYIRLGGNSCHFSRTHDP